MASTDWAILPNSIDNASLRSGVTSGLTPPNGGGSFVYGFNSRATGFAGSRVLKYTGVNFDPFPGNTGGRITGALIRLPSGGQTGFAPFLYLLEQANDAAGDAYMLGLQDDDPSFIVLRKGSMSLGLPAGLVGESGILRKSSASIDADTWVHLRMDVIVQGTGDVLIQVFQNDLTANDVTAPVWEAIPGMDDYTDDSLGINTGSLPYVGGGRAGFGCFANDVSRRAAFDQITIARQLP
jgi:hypothetical protein